MPKAGEKGKEKVDLMKPKCRPPVGLKTRFCVALDKVMIGFNETRAGVYIVQFMKFSTGKERVVGVAARRSSKDKPIFFNLCPFCGERILWLRSLNPITTETVALGKGKRS